MSRTYHFDGLGSTMALTDENGEVTDRYTYDEWGNLTGHTGPGTLTTDSPYQYVGRYGYYTHYQEPDFGLLQLGVRYYDPTIGRFTQIDPARDGINWYAYVDGNPVGAVDPSGMAGCGVFCGWREEDYRCFRDACEEILWPGLATGFCAVGSACTLGYWDGGSWKDEPGFGTSKCCAYVGLGAGCAAGGIAAYQAIVRAGILLEGPCGTRILQIRPRGCPPWFRLDYGPVYPRLPRLPHFHMPPCLEKHLPWEWFWPKG